MHTKGVTMCTFTPVTENKVIRNNFLYNTVVSIFARYIFKKLKLYTYEHTELIRIEYCANSEIIIFI